MPKFTFPRRTSVAKVAVTVVALASVAMAGQAAFSSSGDQYVVQPGDTLWAISQRAGVSVQALASANGMALTDILPIGRHLTIPGSSAAATTESEPADSVGQSGATVGSTFCATFSPTTGPWGELPYRLRANPSRLALQPYFQRWAWDYGVSPALLEAIAWQESGWQEGVVSSAQAVGVGQLLPGTAAFVSHDLIGEQLDINSVNDNIRMMARFVAWLQTQVQGTCNVIAAYYEGTQNLQAYGVLPETEPYVANVEYLLPEFS